MNSYWTPTARQLMNKRLWILGYYSEDYEGDFCAFETLRQQSSYIDVYADFAYQLQPDGQFLGQVNIQTLQEAIERGIAPLIHFHNFNGRVFDPLPLRSVLSSTASQRNCIHHMINSLPPNVAGIHVDFKGVEAAFRIPFLTFLESLSVTLHDRGLLLTIALAMKQPASGRKSPTNSNDNLSYPNFFDSPICQ